MDRIRNMVRDGKYYDTARAISELSPDDIYNAVLAALAEAEQNGIELAKSVVVQSAVSFSGERLRKWGQYPLPTPNKANEADGIKPDLPAQD